MGIRVEDSQERLLTSDPPDPIVPRPITAATTTHGHRLVTATPQGYRREIRAYGNPYYRHVRTQQRWERDQSPPAGVELDDPDVVLFVDACTDYAWHAWAATGADPGARRGGTQPLNAEITWIMD